MRTKLLFFRSSDISAIMAAAVLGCALVGAFLNHAATGQSAALALHPFLSGGFGLLSIAMLARARIGRIPTILNATSAFFVILSIQILTTGFDPEWSRFNLSLIPSAPPSAHGHTGHIAFATTLVLCGLHLALLAELWGRRLPVAVTALVWGVAIPTLHLFLLDFARHGFPSAGLIVICLLLSLVGQSAWLSKGKLLQPVFLPGRTGMRVRAMLVAMLGFTLSLAVILSRFSGADAGEDIRLALVFGLVNLVMSSTAIWLGALMQQLRSALDAAASIDPISGALSRRGVTEMSKKVEVKGVILFEIDDFRQTVDQFGVELGEALLRETVRTIGTSLRENDLLARWDAGRFFVFVDVPDADILLRTANRLRQRIETVRLENAGPAFGPVRASFGLGMVESHETNIEGAVQRAEMSLGSAATPAFLAD